MSSYAGCLHRSTVVACDLRDNCNSCIVTRCSCLLLHFVFWFCCVSQAIPCDSTSTCVEPKNSGTLKVPRSYPYCNVDTQTACSMVKAVSRTARSATYFSTVTALRVSVLWNRTWYKTLQRDVVFTPNMATELNRQNGACVLCTRR